MNQLQAEYYENIGDTLKGDEQLRAYRAAQNHLPISCDPRSKTYLINLERLQSKIISNLENQIKSLKQAQ